MHNIFISHYSLVWPFVLLCAWFSGEIGYQLFKIPRISFYVLVGFLFAHGQFGFLPHHKAPEMFFCINLAIGLILFEFGYRINLNWLKNNPLIMLTGIVESIGTFLVIFIISKLFGFSTLLSFEFASLTTATSPVVVMYLINHQRSSGQVTERIIHLTVFNCILAIFSFKLIFGLIILERSGDLWQATWASILMILLSILLGAFFAILLATIIKKIKTIALDRTIAFAIMIIFIVVAAEATNLSVVIATLTFGLISRYRRVAMSAPQRNFGALGELLTVILFVSIPSALNWHSTILSFGFAIILILARFCSKLLITAAFSYYDNISWNKSVLTGLALSPISVFSLLFLTQPNYMNIALNQELSALAAVFLISDIVGPIVTQYALKKAKESI